MINANIFIRKITAEDWLTLSILARETFTETYAWGNDPDNLANYLDTHFSESQLKKELRHPESHFYLACDLDEPAAYLKVNTGTAQTELQGQNGLEIERIYVRKANQGQGIGQHLFQLAADLAKEKGKDHLWLGVWEKNRQAIEFYQKMGFLHAGFHTFVFGNEKQSDWIMKLDLR